MANKKPLGDLPSSKDKSFWGKDAEQFADRPKKIATKKKHKFIQRGHEAICTSCPFTHAVYLGKDQEVRNGKIVKKKIRL